MGSKGNLEKGGKQIKIPHDLFVLAMGARECTLSYHVRDTLSFFDHIFDRNI